MVIIKGLGLDCIINNTRTCITISQNSLNCFKLMSCKLNTTCQYSIVLINAMHVRLTLLLTITCIITTFYTPPYQSEFDHNKLLMLLRVGLTMNPHSCAAFHQTGHCDCTIQSNWQLISCNYLQVLTIVIHRFFGKRTLLTL